VIKTQKAGDFSPALFTQTHLNLFDLNLLGAFDFSAKSQNALLPILLDARGAQAGKAVTLD
jgi:hypothetical protein